MIRRSPRSTRTDPLLPYATLVRSEREIQSLRVEIETLQEREHELERGIAAWRDRLLAAEQQRDDAQRGLYMAHRSVSELAGQLQSQQGRLESARNRIARIDGEVEQLVETLDASRAQSREARSKPEDADPRMRTGRGAGTERGGQY